MLQAREEDDETAIGLIECSEQIPYRVVVQRGILRLYQPTDPLCDENNEWVRLENLDQVFREMRRDSILLE
jgi:hypothetical protein